MGVSIPQLSLFGTRENVRDSVFNPPTAKQTVIVDISEASFFQEWWALLDRVSLERHSHQQSVKLSAYESSSSYCRVSENDHCRSAGEATCNIAVPSQLHPSVNPFNLYKLT
ncbi:uncharacterized protein YALI1_F35015g [Yarrowia lipolytica]|uniref:Uncharacterized protein n=1 Tax=Yarrowia lipolytica TaxID=4952 RepID=A0A1D8NQ85_YARLL|nr:hypothetical protein YALI1_F35015g [Yarrowia lipolytica]